MMKGDHESGNSGVGRPGAAARVWLALAVGGLLACDLGGGGGGGPSDTPLPVRPIRGDLAEPTDGIGRGALLFREQGCVLCHGAAGKGGVANLNSETGGKINGLALVKEGYSREQLLERLRDGVPEVGRADRNGPTPPFRMIPYGQLLNAQQLSDLADYVLSLYPKDRVPKDDWDSEDADVAPKVGGSK